jgi:hypothetical protein
MSALLKTNSPNSFPIGEKGSKTREGKRTNSWFEIAVAVLVLLVVGVFGGAQAQTAPTCPGPPTSTLTSVDYDPLSPVDKFVDFTMSMPAGTGYTGTEQKDIRIWKELRGAETEGVQYDVFHTAGGNLTEIGRYVEIVPNSDWVWRGSSIKETSYSSSKFPAGVSGNATARIQVVKNQALAPGDNSIEFASSAFYNELTFTSVCPYDYGSVATATQSFTLNVASVMALSLAGGSTTGTIDFGNALATDATRTVYLRLRSNVAYKVTMDSTHNGVLKLGNQAAGTEQIAYTTTLDNTPISETTQFVNTNPTGTGGADITLPFEVTIGDTSNARAGFYKDIVTLTIGSPP